MGVVVAPGKYTPGQRYKNANGVYEYKSDGTFKKISSATTGAPNVVKGVIQDVLTDGVGNALDSIPYVDPEAVKASATAGLEGLQSQLGDAVQSGITNLTGSLSSLLPKVPTAAPPPTPGLASRSVQTVPVDNMGQPVTSTTAPTYQDNPTYQAISSVLGPPGQWNPNGLSAPQQADDWLTSMLGNGDKNYRPPGQVQVAPTPDVALPQTSVPPPTQTAAIEQPVLDPFGTIDPTKNQAQLTTPSSAYTDPNTVLTANNVTPLPYPVSDGTQVADTTAPPSIIMPPTPVQGGTPGQETAVASELDTSPLPDNSPRQPGNYLPPFIEPPMVKIASGKTVPVGTMGSAQGGSRNYEVMPDGSVWSGDRLTSPPTINMPPLQTATTPKPASTAPTASSANGFMDFFNRTPMGHIVQAVSGQPVEGGLFKALGVNSGSPSVRMPAMPGSPNPSATYWDPKSGSWVNQ